MAWAMSSSCWAAWSTAVAISGSVRAFSILFCKYLGLSGL